jgi:ribokinase
MQNKKIIVVGSTNMDMVVQADHIPEPGETILSGSFFMNPGGKGANQAVAIARLGGDVGFITKLGNDLFGSQFLELFRKENIHTSGIVSDTHHPSGVALITVDRFGENSIVVASGANAHLCPVDVVEALNDANDVGFLLVQLEIPMETVAFTIDEAARRNIKVILNPAPAAVLDKQLLQKVDVLTPNKMEAGMISEIRINDLETAMTAARNICARGIKNVVITMGAMGAVVSEGTTAYVVEAPAVTAVDTTGAGDVFNGALVVALSEGKQLKEAVGFACNAAAMSVMKLGAQPSIPTRRELDLWQRQL